MNALDLIEESSNTGLSRVEITHGTNGYPEGLGDWGIVDFEDYEQAQEFADEYDLEIHLFHSKQGWHFWEDRGQKFESLTAYDYLNDLGDNYSEFDGDVDYMWGHLEDIGLEEASDLHLLKDKIEQFIVLTEDYERMEDDQIMIVCEGNLFEIVDEKLMGYNEDTHLWKVGVLVPKGKFKTKWLRSGERVTTLGKERDLGHGTQVKVRYVDGSTGWEHEKDLLD